MGAGANPPYPVLNMRDRSGKLDRRRAPKTTCWLQQLGVDALFVDEAHGFRISIPDPTKAAGIPPEDAQRATDMYLKTRHINKLSNYRNVVFATGTPVSNSMAEIFVMQKMLQEQALERANINQFDSWLAQFGLISVETELDPSGTGMSARPTLKDFRNLPELAQMFRQIADVQMIDDLPELKKKRPKLKDGAIEEVTIPFTPLQSQKWRNSSSAPTTSIARPEDRQHGEDHRRGPLRHVGHALLDRRTPTSSATRCTGSRRRSPTSGRRRKNKDAARVHGRGHARLRIEIVTPRKDATRTATQSCARRPSRSGIAATTYADLKRSLTEGDSRARNRVHP